MFWHKHLLDCTMWSFLGLLTLKVVNDLHALQKTLYETEFMLFENALRLTNFLVRKLCFAHSLHL